MCQKSFAKFRAGDFSLDDVPWSGKPDEADSDQIKTLNENNKCYTTQEIADILKIPKLIKLLVKMKNVSFILWKKLNKLFSQLNTCHNSQQIRTMKQLIRNRTLSTLVVTELF